MILGDVINNLKGMQCKREEFKEKVTDTFRGYSNKEIMIWENGKDFFTDKKFDVDYQVLFNADGEPAVKMKVDANQSNNIVKVLDAWV